MAWDRLAPWDPKTGSLIVYTNHSQTEIGYGEERRKIDWRKADVPFKATLEFQGFERGRSAARSIWKIKGTEGQVVMFLADIQDTLKQGHPIEKTMHGRWIVVKRGSDFGVRRTDLT